MMTSHGHCLGKAGLAVFGATADQRYLLGPEVFMRTHSPITLRRFRNGREPETVCEDNLLAHLLTSAPASQGNRVFVLYGAAGSGKSELMRWVQTRLGQDSPARAETSVRVARTELDALVISEKFRRLLHHGYFEEVTHRRWQMARRKPRTLTKLVVLSALESLLDDDEAINALFYRLTNAIQPHMAHCLGVANAPGAVDILSRETWNEVISETVLPVSVDYEILRHQMLVALQSHLLEGLDLPSTLRLISEHIVSMHNLRPLLLVDDLVQSLNLFATDLLDYFVTLESGQWDVILGMTPAAFETTQRGRELLQRIAYLDTLDDRVTKLWLSDDAGTESYFLNEDNCDNFAARYLAEHRRLNTIATTEPEEGSSCLVTDGDGSLCPFNRELLVRVFRGLPTGKGKARYFLNALHEVLERTSNGTPLLAALDGVAKLEVAARCEDDQLARIAELYGPLVQDGGLVTLGVDLVRFFGLGDTALTIEVEPLTRRRVVRTAVAEVIDDEETMAIHAWMQGKPVNRQLLRGLRRGTARWLRASVSPDLIFRDGIAKPHGALRWRQTYLDTSPPICLEDVDESDRGILLRREVGPLAFDLYRYATATGVEARRLLRHLSTDARLIPTTFEAVSARQQAIARLESQLSMPVSSFAFRLWFLLYTIGGVEKIGLSGFFDETLSSAKVFHSGVVPKELQFGQSLEDAIRHLFDDFFMLRTNVYDQPEIARLLNECSPETILQPLLELELGGLDGAFWMRKQRLSEVLRQVSALATWLLMQAEKCDSSLSPTGRSWLTRLEISGQDGILLSQIPSEVLAELRSTGSDLYLVRRSRATNASAI